MKNKITQISQKIFKNSERIIVVLTILFFLFFAYLLYFMFNRPAESAVVNSIRQESESSNITFDRKTVDKILELNKKYDSPINTSIQGRNSFLTY